MTHGNIKENLMTRAMLLSLLMSQAMYQNLIVNSIEAGPSSRLQAGWFVNASFGHAKQYQPTTAMPNEELEILADTKKT